MIVELVLHMLTPAHPHKEALLSRHFFCITFNKSVRRKPPYSVNTHMLHLQITEQVEFKIVQVLLGKDRPDLSAKQ